jgi:hypothetical protein
MVCVLLPHRTCEVALHLCCCVVCDLEVLFRLMFAWYGLTLNPNPKGDSRANIAFLLLVCIASLQCFVAAFLVSPRLSGKGMEKRYLEVAGGLVARAADSLQELLGASLRLS